MPTPVSTFSPFTPLITPAPSSHNTGGYFDRPTANNVNISSPLSRRPELRNSGIGSSSLVRMSRLPCSSDGSRQQSENGWRLASRMRDEAWSAWEKALGSVSINTNRNLNPSSDALWHFSKTNLGHSNTHTAMENQSDNCQPIMADALEVATNLPRATSDSCISTVAPPPNRLQSPIDNMRPPHLEKTSRSFDASSLGNRLSCHEIENQPIDHQNPQQGTC